MKHQIEPYRDGFAHERSPSHVAGNASPNARLIFFARVKLGPGLRRAALQNVFHPLELWVIIEKLCGVKRPATSRSPARGERHFFGHVRSITFASNVPAGPKGEPTSFLGLRIEFEVAAQGPAAGAFLSDKGIE
jgi:hypothetical protein